MSRPLRIYIACVSAVFWIGIAAVLITGRPEPVGGLIMLAPLFGLAIMIEAVLVRLDKNSISFSATAHVAAAIVFGPVAAALIAAWAVIVVDGVRLAPRWNILFNSAMFGSAIWVAGEAYLLVGGHTGSAIDADDALPLIVLIGTRLLINELIFSGAEWLSSGRRFIQVFWDGVRGACASGVAEGCLGVLVAYGYSRETWVVLLFIAPLLALLYQASAGFERLKGETTNVLNTFAGVIDERDPSTARHSRRVADYVSRFAAAIQLGERESERLVAAARFHDLGKVAVDVATLSKSARLSAGELRAIRRHPRLSARLLTPFHFAREMALYAELHHERYDGNGYYSVSQRNIPVEAHVLIVADSFDAMTSARAYRPALSNAEAVQELRDKAGTQFHPLVANAFAAMIEGEELPRAMGRHQLAALRAEFSQVGTVDLRWMRTLLRPGPVAVALAGAVLILLGVPGIPQWLIGGLAAAGLIATSWTVSSGARGRRRGTRALSALDDGAPASKALAAGGVKGRVLWLEWSDDADCYKAQFDHDDPPSASVVAEICKRAVRPNAEAVGDQLADGTWITLSPGGDDLPRLAVAGHRRLSSFERSLLTLVAERTNPTAVTSRTLDLIHGDQRGDDSGTTPAVILIDLATFEHVRLVAGHLTAERVVGDALARIQTVLRAGDEMLTLSEDRFAVITSVPDQADLDAICERLREIVSDVPVPRRASQIRPRIRAALGVAAMAHPDFASVVAQARPAADGERAAS